MTKGSSFRFYIPAALGYGSRSVGDIPANSLLIFTVELVDITEPAPMTWFQKIFLQPIFGPVKLLHVLMFFAYTGFKYFMRSPGSSRSGGASCKASHILVKTEKEIKAIHKRLNALPKVTV